MGMERRLNSESGHIGQEVHIMADCGMVYVTIKAYGCHFLKLETRR